MKKEMRVVRYHRRLQQQGDEQNSASSVSRNRNWTTAQRVGPAAWLPFVDCECR